MLKPGGRLAFYTIVIAPEVHGERRARARRDGPPAVGSRMSYGRMLALAGFSEVDMTDVTSEFRRASDAWLKGTFRYEEELRAAHGDAEYNRRLPGWQAHAGAVADGLLERAMFVAVK